MKQSVCALAACVMCAAPVAQAAEITWGTAQDTTASNDVLNTGTLIYALNGGVDSAKPTVNGVPFQGVTTLISVDPKNTDGMLGGGNTGDAAFDQLLNTAEYGGGSNRFVGNLLGPFTEGHSYNVQVVFCDQRENNVDRVMQFGSTNSVGLGTSTVDVEGDVGDDTVGSPFGQYTIGTFVADGDDPDLTLEPLGFANTHWNAMQVRDVSSIHIVNAGFENPTHGNNDGTDPIGWTVIESSVGAQPERQVRTRNNARRSGEMGLHLNAGGSSPDGQLWQAVTTEPRQRYVLSVWSKANTATLNQNFKIDVRDGTGTNGVVLGSLSSDGAITDAWTKFSTNLVVASSTSTIHISDVTTSGGNSSDIWLDDITMVESPFPGTFLLVR